MKSFDMTLPALMEASLAKAESLALDARAAALAGDQQEADRLRAEFEALHDSISSELDRLSREYVCTQT